MNKIKEYAIFPGQIKINNCTYFGLDYDLTDFVNNLAEQNKKYKEVIDKAKEYIWRTEINSIGTPLAYITIGKELLDIIKEVE